MARLLVVPNDTALFRQLEGYGLVTSVDSLGDARATADAVRSCDAHLHCLRVQVRRPLAALTFGEELRGISIALEVPSLGQGLAGLLRQIAVLKTLDVRVYLPANCSDNFSAVRILSSLGIETALDLRHHAGDWDAVADAMTYALLNVVDHAPIAPFNYLAARYGPHRRNDYAAVYFDDPQTYLHVDRVLNVALTAADLAAGRFAGRGREAVEGIEGLEAYRRWKHAWRDFFLRSGGCAYCAGWRVCLGKYEASVREQPGCERFAEEFMDAIDQARGKPASQPQVWQP